MSIPIPFVYSESIQRGLGLLQEYFKGHFLIGRRPWKASVLLDGYVQTMLHIIAKEMISELGEIYLPKHVLYVNRDGLEIDDYMPEDIEHDRDPNEEYFTEHYTSYTPTRKPRQTSNWYIALLGDPYVIGIKGGMRKIDSVKLEKRLDGLVPDIILNVSGKELIVEIAVTHFVDMEKLQKIRKHDYAAIEIDLSYFYKNWKNTQDLSGLKEILLQHSKHKKWIHSPNDEFVINREIEKRLKEKDKQEKEQLEQAKIEKRKSEYREKMQQINIDRAADVYKRENYQRLIEKHASEISTNKFWQTMLRKHLLREDIWPDIIDIPIHGEIIFGCDRKVWQGAIFYYLVYDHEGVSCAFADRKLIEWMKDTLYKDLVYTKDLQARGLPTHADVVKAYFRALMDNDVIEYDSIVKWRKYYKVKMNKASR